VAEAARVDSKELGKESESIASEGIEGHWDHWDHWGKAAERRRDGQRDGGRNDGNASKYHRRHATCIQSNVQPEKKLVVVVVVMI
jgi:hypothetical protein